MLVTYYRRYQGSIIIGVIVLAFICGITLPQMFQPLQFISTAFINLLKMCALPIILAALIVTIGNLEQLHELKVIARNCLVYILFTEIIAVTIGMVLFNTVDISANIDAKSLLQGASYAGSTATKIEPMHIFNYLFSPNIFQALANFDVLPIVIFSILFGITCAFNREKAQPLLQVLQSVKEIFLSLLHVVMYLAPLAIFVLIGNSVAQSYLAGTLSANLLGLLKFVGLFLGGLFLHFLWQVSLVLMLYRTLAVKTLAIESMPIFVSAFVSSSSIVTLPVALDKAVKLGGKGKVVNFMLPICAAMNFASGMMYEMAACLFFMHILGIHPGMTAQILLAIACILTGIAVGGIPETSMVSFVTVFGMANIPLSAIAILLPLDRILDRIRTMVNIFGNTCGTLIVSKTIR